MQWGPNCPQTATITATPPQHPVPPASPGSLSHPLRTSHTGQRRLEGAALHGPLYHLLLLALGRAGDAAEGRGVPGAGPPLLAHQVLQQQAVLQRRGRLRAARSGGWRRCRHDRPRTLGPASRPAPGAGNAAPGSRGGARGITGAVVPPTGSPSVPRGGAAHGELQLPAGSAARRHAWAGQWVERAASHGIGCPPGLRGLHYPACRAPAPWRPPGALQVRRRLRLSEHPRERRRRQVRAARAPVAVGDGAGSAALARGSPELWGEGCSAAVRDRVSQPRLRWGSGREALRCRGVGVVSPRALPPNWLLAAPKSGDNRSRTSQGARRWGAPEALLRWLWVGWSPRVTPTAFEHRLRWELKGLMVPQDVGLEKGVSRLLCPPQAR